ncbi:hypothetical protein [Corynebacterium auris]|uniref:hypothetical protein n=1 Tax=Corynebacterium auris TaxID=44750 RepID=UPI0025B566CF|nr:hypothetical protein [Corynebacterium auris]WJY67975.1 hypothetical protein CAURIS_05340 [Corynebacterium auris]
MLHRPGEGVEDQGLAFALAAIETRLTHRRLLSLFGVGAGSLALAACAPGGKQLRCPAHDRHAHLTDRDENRNGGLYPGDGSNGPDVLGKVGVERRDIRESIGGGSTVSGVPLTLRMNVPD